MIRIKPTRKRYATYEGTKEVSTIYRKALNSLYRIDNVSKLFFENLSTYLVDNLGFEVDQYGVCAANEKMNGK